MQAIARSPGSCGELLQGTLSGTNFLVTCPIDIFSEVKVTITDNPTVKVSGEGHEKVREAVRLALQLCNLTSKGAIVEINSQIPRGKGMASSTADIVAAIAALSRAAEQVISPRQLADLALQIEPSDGIMFSGIALFDHVQGKMLEIIGPAPDMDLVIVDLGGEVDTREFNQREELPALNKENEPEIKRALAMLKRGFSTGNRQLIAKAATISAFANQKILYKEKLPEIHNLAVTMGALGINVAHSGTVVGLLFDPISDKTHLDQKIKSLLDKECIINHRKMVNGGVEVLTGERSEPLWEKYNMFMGETYGRQQKSMV